MEDEIEVTCYLALLCNYNVLYTTQDSWYGPTQQKYESNLTY